MGEERKTMKELIAESSIGAGLRDIKERGIDAHLADLEKELPDRRKPEDKPPTLHMGIAKTRCRSCKAEIVFAVAYATGKKMPLQVDDAGEWIVESGMAKHAGPAPVQADMFAGEKVQRYSSHFSTCPAAGEHRKR